MTGCWMPQWKVGPGPTCQWNPVVNEKLGGLTSGMFAIFSSKYTLQILTLVWRISAPLVKKDHYQRTCQGNQESESTTEKLDWRNYNRMHQFKTGIETATFEKHVYTWIWAFKWEKNIKFCLEKTGVSLKKKKKSLKILGNRLHKDNSNCESVVSHLWHSVNFKLKRNNLWFLIDQSNN